MGDDSNTLSNAVLGVWVQLLHEVKRSLGQVIKIFQLSPSTATTTRVASSISHTSHTSIKSLYEDANSSALNASTPSPSPSANPRPNCFMMLQIMIMNTIWTLALDTGHSAGESTCQLVGQGRHFKWFNVIVFEQICSTPEKLRCCSLSLYSSAAII